MNFQRSLQHENLVRLLGLVIEEGKGGGVKSKIFLVTEFMGKGSLLEYLRSRGRQYVTKKDQIGFAFDTACGMAYLESRWSSHFEKHVSTYNKSSGMWSIVILLQEMFSSLTTGKQRFADMTAMLFSPTFDSAEPKANRCSTVS